MSKPTVREHNKSIFVPTCHLCGVVGHIRLNCSLLRQKQKFETRFAVRNTDVPNFVHVCHFCGVSDHIRPNCHKLKFKHSLFQSRICDDIFPVISPNKLFHMLLKNLNSLACERNLQNFSLSQKIGVIPQIHSVSHGFSPTKSKTRAIWVRKDFPRWVLLTCPWYNSFNCLWTCLFLFLVVLFFRLFFLLKKNPKTLKNFKKTKIFYFMSSFIFLEDYLNYDISLLV